MQIYHNSYSGSKPTAVALGNFDGVHIGHKKLIEKIVKTEGMVSLVYTFLTHPLNDLLGEDTVKSINTKEEVISVFEELGVEEILFDSFMSVHTLSPETFVEQVLIKRLHAREVVCGFNYRFGYKNRGDAELLSKLLASHGVHLTIIPEVSFEGDTVSSTLVREALSSGNLERATALLGRPHFIKSRVSHGKALGREIGFPTVNLDFLPSRLALPNGVYFGICTIDAGERYPSVINIGIRPTVDDDEEKITIEAHIIGFKGDLYDSELTLEFFKRHRSEVKFPSLSALSLQISKDVEECLLYFKKKG